MRIQLTVVEGPFAGKQFEFARHDTFLVGRSRHAHFQLPTKDRFASRIHFLVEVQAGFVRVVDMSSNNGIFVNGRKTLSTELNDGDTIRAGHTVMRFSQLPEEE